MINRYEDHLIILLKQLKMTMKFQEQKTRKGITKPQLQVLDQQTQQNASIAKSKQEKFALQTDLIAKDIVTNALSKEFVGKRRIPKKNSE